MKKPQFSLRDLVWLVVVCALSLSWWMDHQRLKAKVPALEYSNGILMSLNTRLSTTLKTTLTELEQAQRELADQRSIVPAKE